MNDSTITTFSLDPEDADDAPEEDAFALEARLVPPDPIREKLADAQTPGYQAEFDPPEAELAGAFPEDALTEEEALASTHDYLHFVPLSSPLKP